MCVKNDVCFVKYDVFLQNLLQCVFLFQTNLIDSRPNLITTLISFFRFGNKPNNGYPEIIITIPDITSELHPLSNYVHIHNYTYIYIYIYMANPDFGSFLGFFVFWSHNRDFRVLISAKYPQMLDYGFARYAGRF